MSLTIIGDYAESRQACFISEIPFGLSNPYERKDKPQSIKINLLSDYLRYRSGKGGSLKCIWTASTFNWKFERKFKEDFNENNNIGYGWYAVLHKETIMLRDRLLGVPQNLGTEWRFTESLSGIPTLGDDVPNVLTFSGYGAGGLAAQFYEQYSKPKGNEILIHCPKGAGATLKIFGLLFWMKPEPGYPYNQGIIEL